MFRGLCGMFLSYLYFIRFLNCVLQNIKNAITARRALDATYLGKDDTKRIRAGFGRSQPSRKLWVGGLGPWTTRSMLEKEFDRYGQIEELEYNEGDEFGYVT